MRGYRFLGGFGGTFGGGAFGGGAFGGGGFTATCFPGTGGAFVGVFSSA